MIVENPKTITEDELRNMAKEAKGRIRKIYLHWTTGHYGEVDDAYHLCIDRDGQVFVNCKNLSAVKAHTWLRNQNTVAIALCCCAGAACWIPGSCNAEKVDGAYAECRSAHPKCALVDFGPEPPTTMQIDMMVNVVAVLADELGLAIGKDTVMTHCEIAFKDGYGPGEDDPAMSWDLWFLPDSLRPGEVVPGGNLLRKKAKSYQRKMQQGTGAV
ncbi:MAG: N-acetylmuramoyl-L-alanine amidase [Acidaminococcaceae bacterium]|nr:N-acetylmuramoyl-L-alanine amidase [Acidaminococcaceae bacterium]